jgi:hypothetical protein
MRSTQQIGPRPKGRFDRKSAFLAAYAQCASIKAAAKAAGVSRRRHYKWLQASPDYQANSKKPECFAAAGPLEEIGPPAD